MTTVVQQIEETEASILKCEERLDHIERALRLTEMTKMKRSVLTEEQKRIEKEIAEHKKHLWTLRKENMKSMGVSVAILAVVALGYIVYTNMVGS